MRVALLGDTSLSHGHGVLIQRLIQASSDRITWKVLSLSNIPQIKKSDFDVLYVTSAPAVSLLQETGIPVVLSLQGVHSFKPEWYEKATRVIAPAPSILATLSKVTSKAVLLENAIPESFSPGPPDASLQRRVPTVLYVGRPYPVKRTDLLLKSFEDLPYDLWMVGVQQTFPPVPSKPNVKLWGEQQDTLKFYRTVDAFILPSQSEGMCLALLEAMACGLPCIVSDIPENRETIRDGGVLCQLNVESIQSSIRQVLSNPEVQKELSRKALAVSQTRSYSVWVNRLITIFEEACSSSS